MASCAERERRWRDHVERLSSSGLSREVYCARHGLSRSTLYRWERRLRCLSGPSGALAVINELTLVPLRMLPCVSTDPLSLYVGSGMRLELPRDIDAAWLVGLLRSLAGC
jgi:hypothetical protein